MRVRGARHPCERAFTKLLPGRARLSSAEAQTKIGIMSRATMFATLIIGLIAGPAVSL